MDFSNRLIPLLLIVFLVVSCSKKPHNISENSDELKIDSLIQRMTLEEKIGMIHASSAFTSGGVPRLGIPELIMSDGPHGVRFEHGRDWARDMDVDDSVTYLPTGICLASTWNTELGYQYGAVLGSEAKHRGKDVILGPGVNIIRSPLCGRNFEYLSEDPFLTSRMAVGYIKGVQDQGIAACVKHFAANNQEENRSGINVVVSEQALREIYFPAFEASVREANVLTVMGAYNKINGLYCTQNPWLLNQVLKEEWGFKGLLMSDWGAVHNTREALLSGTDIEMGTDLLQMPNIDYNKFYLADSAIAMVKRGEVPVSVVDDKVRRILRVMFSIRLFGNRTPGEANTKEHQQLALKVAEEGIVLLKNQQILPLNIAKAKKILVVGENATRKHAHGGGSSQVSTKYEITPLEGIKNLVGNEAAISYQQGYEITRENTVNKKLSDDAVAAAKNADVVIFVGGWIHNFNPAEWGIDAYDSEGIDKKNTQLMYGQDKLIRALAEVNNNVVVTFFGGGPVDMAPWLLQVKAVVQAWYPGMEGGTALANILFGKTNPSGKLPMTFAKKLEDNPSHSIGEYPGKSMEVNYAEGIFVGYRYFDTYQVEPEFCFGHGLSYTTFEYSDFMVETSDNTVSLSFNITNSGKIPGAEVAQVYVANKEASVKRPSKELKWFTKVMLEPNETTTVELELPKEAFMFYQETKKQWVLEPGEFEILLGSSSRDIRLSQTVEM
ncbi:MAG TPA: glycosyl hydrolase [Marinilabiliales bacterium]|nr:glycosyl hydrolase [Marinilabiliales bacterium]HAZ03889.1 glycosyl hydrolase [Marinilabiliales bacterium]HBX84316.1 glycosyl hydrolase [Marinilabiliales bacterium]HCC29693.1 glycosyl hydrolase [Marinilabiliales bacterium]